MSPHVVWRAVDRVSIFPSIRNNLWGIVPTGNGNSIAYSWPFRFSSRCSVCESRENTSPSFGIPSRLIDCGDPLNLTLSVSLPLRRNQVNCQAPAIAQVALRHMVFADTPPSRCDLTGRKVQGITQDERWNLLKRCFMTYLRNCRQPPTSATPKDGSNISTRARLKCGGVRRN